MLHTLKIKKLYRNSQSSITFIIEAALYVQYIKLTNINFIISNAELVSMGWPQSPLPIEAIEIEIRSHMEGHVAENHEVFANSEPCIH